MIMEYIKSNKSGREIKVKLNCWS